MDAARGLAVWRAVTLGAVRSGGPDLTQRQMAILLTVCLEPPPHTVKALAQMLRVGKPAITRALDAMSVKGLLKRARGEADRRQVFVRPTDQGLAFLDRLGDHIAAACAGRA